MILPDKYSAFELARVLSRYGVTDVVVSPGSRNAPIVEMLAKMDYRLTPVIDERSAGFIALGTALASRRPVALVCTSGTAVLNYAPAVAEAYYRQMPLIVVSADRPAEWIDQDDSQTLHQPGALAHIVKHTYDICDLPLRNDDADAKWATQRDLMDAMLTATDPQRPGPVHINMQMREPLGRKVDFEIGEWPELRAIEVVKPERLNTCDMEQLIAEAQRYSKILIVGAGYPRQDNSILTDVLRDLSALPQVVLSIEPLANVTVHGYSYYAESYNPDLVPELVISFGGAVVDKPLKRMLRHAKHQVQHWMIGTRERVADPFQCLTKRIEVDTATFFRTLSANLKPKEGAEYQEAWERRRSNSTEVPFTPVLRALSNAPSALEYNLVLSNGYTLREVLRDPSLPYRFANIDCNRGVSGIEGSTSTAVGWQIGDTEHTTLLVTGDMSFAYDIGALACRAITPRLKIIVNNNHGGEIFRLIESTAESECLEQFFVCAPKLPLRQLAEAYGFAYYTAEQTAAFYAEGENPAILEIVEDE